MSDYPGGFDPSSGNPPGGPYPAGQGGSNPPNPQGQPHGGYGQPSQGYGGGYPGAAPSIPFDLGLIKPGGVMVVVGGVLYFVFSFFTWYITGGCVFGVCVWSKWNAWSSGMATTSVIIFLIVALVYVGKAFKIVGPSIPVEIIALAGILIGDIFAFASFVNTNASYGWAMYLDGLFLVAINVGGILQFRRVGGANSLQRGHNSGQQAGPYPPQQYPPQPPQ